MRSWNDQPIEVEDVPIKVSVFHNDRIIELRSNGQDKHFVTTGNLFGSQTVVCETLLDAVDAFGIAAKTPKSGQASLPKGCRVLLQNVQ